MNTVNKQIGFSVDHAIGIATLLALLSSSCALMNIESLEKFNCTLDKIKPNPSGYDFKGKSISYFQYKKGKSELVHISKNDFMAKPYGQEKILARSYTAYVRDGVLIWGDQGNDSFNNYLTIKTMKKRTIVYSANGDRVIESICKKANG
jgi:hypothetical protein